MSGRKIWQVLLACFFLVYGLLLVTNLKFELQNALLGFLAIAVAIFAFLDR